MHVHHRWLGTDRGRIKKLRLGYQASRAELLSRKWTDVDELLGVGYPIRGIKNKEGEWEYGSLSIEEIESLKTDFLYRAFALFSDFNTFNVLPHGGGTLDERPTVLEAIKILKEEESLWQAWEMDKNKN